MSTKSGEVHIARELLATKIQEENLQFKDIFQEAKNIFRRVYEESLREYPNHDVPLYILIAGQNPETKKGFLCTMKSNDDFNEFWIEKQNKPYFTGSNTELVQNIATEIFLSLAKKSKSIRLDQYAIESMRKISEKDNYVSFPIQLTIASHRIINIFPVYENITSQEKYFEISYP